MAKIKQLSSHEAQKIAAGEVIERPSNIVKELVENSIDAGATEITVYIEQAGKKLIRIVDNGYGMDSEDAHLCLAHHATSKIRTFEDLNNIATFGFRGEALASIASVSKTTLITKEESSMHAIKLSIEKGEIINETQVAAPTGTDITIADLFYNVPVRKKFLRTNDTEWNQINYLFQAFCLSNTSIHFKLYAENKLMSNCPATDDLAQRILQVWNQPTATHMLELESSTQNDISIRGMISNHQLSRYDRNHIIFFVNRRWVKNYTLSRALIQGYANVLPTKKFPAACIFIDVPAHEVDVNIHPRKEEVQFLHPRKIQNLIGQCVQTALESCVSQRLNMHDTFIPSISTAKPDPVHGLSFDDFESPFANIHEQQNQAAQSSMYGAQPVSQPHNTPHQMPYQSIIGTDEPFRTTSDTAYIPEIHEQQALVQHSRIIGQCALTYILIETPQGLMMIDQHAAHERVLYEKFCAQGSDKESIPLLFPQMIQLNQHDMNLIEAHLELFHDHGILLEQFDTDKVRVSSIPVSLKNVDIAQIISYVVGWLAEYQHAPDLDKELLHNLRAQMACKGAIKAGDELNESQMEHLIASLEKTPNRLTCPHGRPTTWMLSKDEIERKFKRDYRS